MKFTDEELWYTDITWFALDSKDRVVCFSSLGCGRVPDFIINSKENVELIENHIFEHARTYSSIYRYYYHKELVPLAKIPSRKIKHLKKIPLFNECIELSNRGICCYVPANPSSVDEIIDDYIKVSEPYSFLTLPDLPSPIQELLADQRLIIDAATDDHIQIYK